MLNGMSEVSAIALEGEPGPTKKKLDDIGEMQMPAADAQFAAAWNFALCSVGDCHFTPEKLLECSAFAQQRIDAAPELQHLHHEVLPLSSTKSKMYNDSRLHHGGVISCRVERPSDNSCLMEPPAASRSPPPKRLPQQIFVKTLLKLDKLLLNLSPD